MKRISSLAIEEETSIPDDIPVKEVVGKFGLMHPTSYALEHDAASLLQDWAENGCPVDTGPDWDLEQIEEALRRGPHQSAKLASSGRFL